MDNEVNRNIGIAMKEKLRVWYQKWIGESQYIEERYKRIYGYGRFNEKINLLQRNNKRKYLIILMLLTVLTVNSLVDYTNSKSKMHIDKSNNAYYIDKDSKETAYSFKVKIIKNGRVYSKNVILQFDNGNGNKINIDEPMSEKEKNNILIDDIVRGVNSSEEERVSLPSRLEDGTKIIWEYNKSFSITIYIVIASLFLLLLYKERYSQIDKEEEKNLAIVKKELPVFINKIALLLNSGMVFQSAFMKIVDDNENFLGGNNNYFYQQLSVIASNVRERNYTSHEELENFAKRTRLKEFIRVTNIISDNIYKGVVLTDKLEKEGEQLWFNHKKQIEENGRLAETKLVAPLALLLSILVLITVAPALIEM